MVHGELWPEEVVNNWPKNDKIQRKESEKWYNNIVEEIVTINDETIGVSDIDISCEDLATVDYGNGNPEYQPKCDVKLGFALIWN